MRPPKKPEPDAIEVIDVGEDCYIEISKNIMHILMELRVFPENT